MSFTAPYPTKPTNGLAVASLICGIFAWLTCGLTAPVALVLGIIALNQTRDGSQPGHGSAWAGVILGGISLIISLLFGFLFFVGSTPSLSS